MSVAAWYFNLLVWSRVLLATLIFGLLTLGIGNYKRRVKASDASAVSRDYDAGVNKNAAHVSADRNTYCRYDAHVTQFDIDPRYPSIEGSIKRAANRSSIGEPHQN